MKTVDVNGTRYWVGEGNAASGVLPVCPTKGTVCVAWRSAHVMSPNCWGTIGGAIQQGLTPAESALRELHEEVGYDGEIELVPAYTFRDGEFSYQNFIGVVPTEFDFRPRAQHRWENAYIAWRPYTMVMDDLAKNPKDYHPGLRKLFAESELAIRKQLLFANREGWALTSGKIKQSEIEEWYTDFCTNVRRRALADPTHWINRLMMTERVDGPLYRGMKIDAESRLLTAAPGDVWSFGASSFTRNQHLATRYSEARRPNWTIPVLVYLRGRQFHGIDLSQHVEEHSKEVIVSGSFTVIYTERQAGKFFVAIEPIPEVTLPETFSASAEGAVTKKLFLDDVRQPPDSSWDVVHSFDEFVAYIQQNGVPDAISFDYDIVGEKTGLECARFIIARGTLPRFWSVHSSNPVGRRCIIDEMTAAEKDMGLTSRELRLQEA